VASETITRHGDAVTAQPKRPGTSGARTRLRRLAAVVAPFVVWDIMARMADSRLLPTPLRVVERLWEDIASGTIWFHAKVTLLNGAIGLAIAIVVGISFGALLARSRYAEAVFEPILAAFYPVPKLALYPLLILFLGFGPAAKITLVALECAYPITYNTYAGVQSIRRQYFWVARNVGASRWAMFNVMLRGATPPIMASLRMAAPIMLVIVVVTELIGESRGLGFLVRQAGTNFQPARALGVILLLGIIGFVLDRIILALTRRFAFWAKGVEL
jgi:ABC-type nitrate/sulfonate/bicarbonate transport system permease component